MRTAIRERVLGTTNAASAVQIASQQIKPGQIARITHLALHNQSGESVTAQFEVDQQGDFTQIWPEETVADGDAYGAHVDILLLEGDRIAARVVGTAKSSTVRFFVSGTLDDGGPELVAVTEVTQ